MVKNLPAMQETQVWSLGDEDPLEKEMATHSSILAWRIPCTEEPGRLQSMGSQRVRHDWVTNILPVVSVFFHLFLAHIILIFKKFYWSIVVLQCCYSQVYSQMNQLYMYPLFFFRFFTHIGHYRVLSRLPCVTQYSVMAYMGEESKKNSGYIYNWFIWLYTWE